MERCLIFLFCLWFSASTKRMHDWISGGGGGGGGGAGGDPIHRQESASPEESASSFRKKMVSFISFFPLLIESVYCTFLIQ